MTEINHRSVEVNGLRLHLAEAGSGPLVILLHGFPECWYSWRHQLGALADAGFHVVAPNQRGYPRSDRPTAVEDYTMLHLVGDVVGLVETLGEPDAMVVGHDWGAPVAWHTALLRPDIVRGVVGLSVPHLGRPPVHPLQALRRRFGETFYQIYFQRPGVENDFEADLDTTFRRILYGLSGDSPDVRQLLVASGERFFDSWPEPEGLPSWLTEQDIATYAAEFAGSSFSGPLNWYRNIDRNWELTSAWHGAPVTPPALFLAGDRDPVIARFDTTKLSAVIRAAVTDLRGVDLLAGAGHWIQQERPSEVNSALVDFARAVS